MDRNFIALLVLLLLASSVHAQSESLQRSREYGAQRAQVAEAECRKGDAEACARLAGWYYTGNGVPPDWKKSLELSVRACDLGQMSSCAAAAFLYLDVDDARDPAQAVRRYSQACDGGVADACYRVGLLYEDGLGVAADRGKAEGLFARACTAGVNAACGKVTGADVTQLVRACHAEQWDACTRAAEMYANGQGVAADPAKAAGLYERLCAARDMGACAKSATYHRLAGDPTKAVAIARDACSDPLAPHAESCTILGEHYQAGQGVERDPFSANNYYVRACRGNHARGCVRLAALTSHPVARLEHLAKACELGDGEACTYLAAFYANGENVPPDARKSAGYAESGCEAGAVRACWMLSRLYDGFLEGIEPDRERAIAALERALKIAPGDPELQQGLRELQSRP